MKAVWSFTALLALAAVADVPAGAQGPGQRINRIVVYGNDPCPRGTGDEIVICARRPGGDRYRIPEELRDDATVDDPESTSWAAQAQSLEYVGRTGIQSCSTVGPGGFTGCWAEMMRAAQGERRRADSSQPQ